LIRVGIIARAYYFRSHGLARWSSPAPQYVEAARCSARPRPYLIGCTCCARCFRRGGVAWSVHMEPAERRAALMLVGVVHDLLGIGRASRPTPELGGGGCRGPKIYLKPRVGAVHPRCVIASTVGALNALADAFRDRAGRGDWRCRSSSRHAFRASLPPARRSEEAAEPPDECPPTSARRGPDVTTIEDLRSESRSTGRAEAVRRSSIDDRAPGRDRRAGGGVGQWHAHMPRRAGSAAAGCGCVVTLPAGPFLRAGRSCSTFPKQWEGNGCTAAGAARVPAPASYLNPVLRSGSQARRGACG